MLNVMDKYGPMEKLEELHVKNLSMGSVLILLPFVPNIRKLSMKYSSRVNSNSSSGDGSPNLTDELFLKIFKKNTFPVRKQLYGFLSIKLAITKYACD